MAEEEALRNSTSVASCTSPLRKAYGIEPTHVPVGDADEMIHDEDLIPDARYHLPVAVNDLLANHFLVDVPVSIRAFTLSVS